MEEFIHDAVEDALLGPLPTAFWKKLATGISTPPPPGESSEAMTWPWHVQIVWTVLLLALNVGTTRLVAMPVARLFLGWRRSLAKIEKFAQSFMEFFFYSLSLGLGVSVLLDQAWLWPSANWWTDHALIPSSTSTQVGTLPLEIRFFYVLYCCRYLQGLVSVLLLEHRRKDFWEMVVHHFTTAVLIMLSYASDYVRVGCIVMVLLDVGDPPLHVAKMCKYVSEVKGPRQGFWSTIADLWFGIFVLDFPTTRLGLYSYVVWSSTFELYTVATPELPWAEAVPVIGWHPVACWLMLWLLLALQVFWNFMLFKAVVRVIMKGDLQDTRSDTESGVDTDDEGRAKRD